MLPKLLTLIALLISPIFCLISIDPSRKFFIDEHRRTIIFHGVNVVYKLPPYLPITDHFDPLFSLSDEDILYMKKFGFNLVRFGVIWESVEVKPGEYDMEHLDKVEKLITKLGENGISVILDSHQDMFSRIFCGEGCPPFYAKNLHYEKTCQNNYLSKFYHLVGACLPLSDFKWVYDENQLPLIDSCKKGFLKYQQSPELTSIYQSFYENQLGIQDKFADYWKTLARKFKGNPYIIGYDVWNEPWPGNLWSDVKSLIPGHADHSHVIPFYRKMDKAIREVNPDYVFMFEPVPFPDTLPFGGGTIIGGFKETPADKRYKHLQVLNVHSYCCQAGGNICEKGEPSTREVFRTCLKFHSRKVDIHLRQARKLKVPLIISEFGACSGSEACYNEMLGLVRSAGDSAVSWAYWNYKPYGDHTTSGEEQSEGIFNADGTPQKYKILALTRPYIQAYQGTPLKTKFRESTTEFIASFLLDKTITEPSIIYFNKDLFYPNGYKLRVFTLFGEDIPHKVEVIDNNHVAVMVEAEEQGMVVFVQMYSSTH